MLLCISVHHTLMLIVPVIDYFCPIVTNQAAGS